MLMYCRHTVVVFPYCLSFDVITSKLNLKKKKLFLYSFEFESENIIVNSLYNFTNTFYMVPSRYTAYIYLIVRFF